MKKLYIIALLGLLIPSISQATLYDYYSGIGKNLPSIQERSVVYSEVSDDTYLGTAEQNNALESYLRGSEVLGATTKIKLTDPNSVTPAATTTPTANAIPMADGSGKLDSWVTDFFWGDGSDGDVIISTNTTLTEDKYYKNLTINTGVTLDCGGYVVFVAGTLTNNGTISRAGNNATNGGDAIYTGIDNPPGSGGTAGVGGAAKASGSIAGGLAGKNGASGNAPYIGQDANGGGSTAGENASPSLTNKNGVKGGNSGDTGTSGSMPGVAGNGGTATGETAVINYSIPSRAATLGTEEVISKILHPIYASTSHSLLSTSAGSSGGASGEVDSSTGSWGGSGGGGGAGGNGGIVLIVAKTLVNNGTITVKGGNGGNAGLGITYYNSGNNVFVGGSGGGGGGQGGLIILIYENLTEGTLIYTGGTKGLGATGIQNTGTPTNNFTGANGTDGESGNYIKIKIS